MYKKFQEKMNSLTNNKLKYCEKNCENMNIAIAVDIIKLRYENHIPYFTGNDS